MQNLLQHKRFSNARLPHSYWSELKNQKKFFDSLANEAKITRLEDWYQISRDKVRECGGGGLLDRYNGSLRRGKF